MSSDQSGSVCTLCKSHFAGFAIHRLDSYFHHSCLFTSGDCYFVAAAASLVVGNREQFMRVVPPDQTFDSHDYAGRYMYFLSVLMSGHIYHDFYCFYYYNHTPTPPLPPQKKTNKKNKKKQKKQKNKQTTKTQTKKTTNINNKNNKKLNTRIPKQGLLR